MSATPFETFVDQVNDWMPDDADPVSEAEALDVWSLGQRNPACAAAQIESLRRLAARGSGKVSLGDIITGSLLAPVGMALVALFSLADEAEAATVLVATREGVLAYAVTFGVIGLAVGFIFGWLARAAVVPQDEPTFVDHHDVIQLRKTRVRP